MGHSAFTRLIQGAAVGAVAMYMLDPDRGRRRRALTRDKVQRFANDTARLANQATRDARARLHGINARLQQRTNARDARPLDELRLIERVRAALGRAVSHPHALQVGAHGTTVVLSGPILRHEVAGLLVAARAVAGVTGVENHLDVHDHGDRVPGLQGEGRRRGMPAPENLTPALRLAALMGGGLLALYGLAKRSASGVVLASAGLGVAARAVSNEPLERWLVNTAQGLVRGEQSLEDALEQAHIGADGTPAPKAGSAAMSSARRESTATSASTEDAPLLGADGTPSTAGAQRLLVPQDEEGGAPPAGGEETSRRSVH